MLKRSFRIIAEVRQWLLLSLFVLLSGWAPGQNPVPNPDLENWFDNGSWEDPDLWGTPNPTTFPFGISTVVKDSDAYSGNLAARLSTKGQGSLTVPGVMCTGILDVFANKCVGGFPVSQPYLFFNGYYKYAPDTSGSVSDSCAMIGFLWKWNASMGKRDTVAMANFISGNISAYTQFSAPFNFLSAEIPDSGMVIVSATKNFLSAPIGSILVVDALELSNTVGMEDIPDRSIRVFPNPADDLVNIRLENNYVNNTITVYNSQGKLVHEVQASSPIFEISTTKFNEGFYFFFVLNNAERIYSGSFIVQH